MTHTTMTTAMHKATLHHLTGVGLLAVPADDGTDLWLDHESLTQVDHAAILAKLHAMGWRMVDDGDGIPWVHVGTLDDGRDVILLGADDAITTEPTPDEIEAALIELRREVGMTV